MTGHYQTAAHASTPTLCRETSAFLMKASYQRHMLYGWAVALCVVSIPALLISVWPVEQAPPVPPDGGQADSVWVIVDMSDYVIIDDHPRLPTGGPEPQSNQSASGLFIDQIKLIADSIEFSEEEVPIGPPGNYGEGLAENHDYVFGDGGGGTVFILDTGAYQFNSVELDRPPVMIAMDQPEYPAIAKRAGVEGKVLLHILVDSGGRVAEVRIETEDNPGFGFGKSAVRAARSAVFGPAIANRQPVRCWVAIPVEFELE